MQNQTNPPTSGLQLSNKVDKSRVMPAYIPGDTPPLPPGMGVDKCIIQSILSLRVVLEQGAQKCDHFQFIHILGRFNPIRSQLETVLDFWLVNAFMKECELIKGGRIFGFKQKLLVK